MNSGAMGYLIKHTAADCVCEAIRESSQGRAFFSSSVRKRLQQLKRKKDGDELAPCHDLRHVECEPPGQANKAKPRKI